MQLVNDDGSAGTAVNGGRVTGGGGVGGQWVPPALLQQFADEVEALEAVPVPPVVPVIETPLVGVKIRTAMGRQDLAGKLAPLLTKGADAWTAEAARLERVSAENANGVKHMADSVVGLSGRYTRKRAALKAEMLALRGAMKAERVQLLADGKRYAVNVSNAAKSVAEHTKNKPAPPDMSRLVARLSKHGAVQYLHVSPMGSLIVNMKPTYTLAQVSESSKDRVRMFVGCFQLVIKKSEKLNMSIKNLTFPNLGHWSVNRSNSPCWGDWLKIVQAQYKAGELDALITTMAAYLSSHEDGSAYSRTYRFRDNRAGYIAVRRPAVPTYTPRVGDWCIYKPGGEFSRMAGFPFQVLGFTHIGDEWNTRTVAEFVAPHECYESGTDENRGTNRLLDIYENKCKALTADQVAELDVLREDYVTYSDREEVVDALKVFGNRVLNGGDSDTAIRNALLDRLDTAETLEYGEVAQRLCVNYNPVK